MEISDQLTAIPKGPSALTGREEVETIQTRYGMDRVVDVEQDLGRLFLGDDLEILPFALDGETVGDHVVGLL